MTSPPDITPTAEYPPVPPEPPRPPGPPEPPGRRSTWLVAAVVAVLVLAVGAVALLWTGSGDDAPTAPVATPTATAPSATGAPSATPGPTSGSATPTSGGSAPAVFRFRALWPFASVADAAAWQQQALPGGHQPWRLDPGETAVAFAQTYLGYTEIDRVVSREVNGDEAWIGVGATPPEGRLNAAAVLHLARIGTGELNTRPWEVVGSRDTTLTVTTPRYGSQVGTVLTLGGRITGVDESLSITVHTLGGPVLGQVNRIPAGGTRQPWSATLLVDSSKSRVATVAIATGGHLLEVEKFAVTAIQIRSGAKASNDVDGDGRADRVTVSGSGTLAVGYGNGRTETVAFTPSGAGMAPAVLGTADVDRDGRAEVFVRNDRGAYLETTILFRYTAGHLRLVTLNGEQAALPAGGSVRNQAYWTSDPPGAPIVIWTGTSTGDEEVYPGTLRRYGFVGATLTPRGSLPMTVTAPLPPALGGVLPL
jgi:hypothetical protein